MEKENSPYPETAAFRSRRFAKAVIQDITLERDMRNYRMEAALDPNKESSLIEDCYKESHALITHAVFSMYQDIRQFGDAEEQEMANTTVRVLGGQLPPEAIIFKGESGSTVDLDR